METIDCVTKQQRECVTEASLPQFGTAFEESTMLKEIFLVIGLIVSLTSCQGNKNEYFKVITS